MALAKSKFSLSNRASSVGAGQVRAHPVGLQCPLQGTGIPSPPCLRSLRSPPYSTPLLSKSNSNRRRGTVVQGLPFDQAWAPSVDVAVSVWRTQANACILHSRSCIMH
eukprot:scaffold4888_cov20-Tisochrysis_lutea.AAC.1